MKNSFLLSRVFKKLVGIKVEAKDGQVEAQLSKEAKMLAQKWQDEHGKIKRIKEMDLESSTFEGYQKEVKASKLHPKISPPEPPGKIVKLPKQKPKNPFDFDF